MGLSFTKLFSRLFAKKEARFLMVGLDAAGKTTILYTLKLGKMSPPSLPSTDPFAFLPPIFCTCYTGGGDCSIHFNFLISHSRFSQTADHIGKRLWRFYFKDTQGLIFVVDSNDRDRMGSPDELIDAKLLVFANKQDLPNAMTAAEITDKLGLHSLGQRCWHIHNTSAISREGLYEGLDWLSNNIADKVTFSYNKTLNAVDLYLNRFSFVLHANSCYLVIPGLVGHHT
ncbi:unnamed protein product [Ilex paraguariensis]|uniref:ADP-ribosylation factor 1 n=1 Tax=Ilex paraguariensis TaxID=185542 RepID=A0ABC8V2T9_9AQUA